MLPLAILVRTPLTSASITIMLHNLTKISVVSISGINYSYLTSRTLGECECRKFASAKIEPAKIEPAKIFRDAIDRGYASFVCRMLRKR